jgi:hypothetical protein
LDHRPSHLDGGTGPGHWTWRRCRAEHEPITQTAQQAGKDEIALTSEDAMAKFEDAQGSAHDEKQQQDGRREIGKNGT